MDLRKAPETNLIVEFAEFQGVLAGTVLAAYVRFAETAMKTAARLTIPPTAPAQAIEATRKNSAWELD